MLAAAFAFALPAPSAMAQGFINVLTGGTSGVYYPLGVAIGLSVLLVVGGYFIASLFR